MEMNKYPRKWNQKIRRWVYDHRIKAEEKIGRKLKKDEVVHHVDGDPKNFEKDNLHVEKRSQHCRTHKPENFRKVVLGKKTSFQDIKVRLEEVEKKINTIKSIG